MSFEYEMKICCCPNPRYLLQHHYYNIVLHTYIQKVEQLRETQYDNNNKSELLRTHKSFGSIEFLLPKGPKSASHNNTTQYSLTHLLSFSQIFIASYLLLLVIRCLNKVTLLCLFFSRLGWCSKCKV